MAVRLIRAMEDLMASGSQLIWSMAHQTWRRWLLPCRRLLVAWFRTENCYQMSEGRQCQVHLLDGRKLQLQVQPKLLSRDLLDLVSSHFNLKEKDYFGLCFIDDTGQNNWLQLDRKVLDHDFSKTSTTLELKFYVRFYIEKITFLKENTTVELFFLNAKSMVFNETIEVESGHVFKLAAFALQEANGDYTCTETARSDLKQLPVLPTQVLRKHPSLSYCEDKVIDHYKKLKGLTRGQAIVKYLALVESLPTYGVHYYPVKDKQGIPWWLGVSYKGIGQYDLQDKLKPRKLFQWKQLENLYFREKKFAVEVNDPHSRTVNKRTFGQAGLVIHSWYASHSLIKTIWVMAISQHQFYLDRKQSRSNMTTTRSSGDIAMDLTEIASLRITKLTSLECNDQLIMASSGSLISAGSADSDVAEEQKREKIAEMKKKEKSLQDTLLQKLEELKKICLREAELTGALPKEYPLATGEKAPRVRRRVGTEFKLEDLFPYNEDPDIRDLESRLALQRQFVQAADKLTKEGDMTKAVKKKRQNNYQDAKRIMEAIEIKLNDCRVKNGRQPIKRASVILDDLNPSDLSSLSDSFTLDEDGDISSQRQRSTSVHYSPRSHHEETLRIHYSKERRASTNDQHTDSRFIYSQIQEPVSHSHHGALLSPCSPYTIASRQPGDARSMPPTPMLTRNAYSSTQLKSEHAPQHFRQRSESLESQSQLLPETEPPLPTFRISPTQRSNSTEVLDDGSSYTSQSSVENVIPGNHNHNHRRRTRGRHKKDIYANTGSMPNLAQPETHCYAYHPRARPTTTAYYLAGFPGQMEPEPYSSGVHMYGNETEGHYSVNPSHHPKHAVYRAHDTRSRYGTDEIDGASQNLYATLRPPRNRPGPRSEEQTRNFQKEVVTKHLVGWYQRNTAYKQGVYNYDRGSTQSVSYQTMPAPISHNNRNLSYSSASIGNWHDHGHISSRSILDCAVPKQTPQTFKYTTAPFNHSTLSRSYVDVKQVSSNQTHTDTDPQDRICWHEDSEPGTIV
ncbi:FERM domain-containing protein 4B isoform X2 [Nerophis lumbriciformis]|uniref:FERM domain-containing protein 4B isoform X2 n=1 Tax=Nerophis lumbriciformis TaxID=546530 RepID=UPI002ADF87DF|nr:FERM domain-containing protein 4B-like isoform X2 [Nerophis lumbriciformis]